MPAPRVLTVSKSILELPAAESANPAAKPDADTPGRAQHLSWCVNPADPRKKGRGPSCGQGLITCRCCCPSQGSQFPLPAGYTRQSSPLSEQAALPRRSHLHLLGECRHLWCDSTSASVAGNESELRPLEKGRSVCNRLHTGLSCALSPS